MLTLRPASDLLPRDLLALWNAAYSGYIVPVTFDQAMLDRHIRRGGLDLDRSVAGAIDGEDIGLSLTARRDGRAWIGGFGIAERFRRRGLATCLMQAHLDQLTASGVGEVWLEVIDANPAREVYRRCGFAEVRELLVLEGLASAAGEQGEDLTVAALAGRHAALNSLRPTWRRDLPTVLDGLAVEGATALGVDGGYAVALEQGERLAVLDAAAADRDAADRLLGALAERWPGRPLRLVDEDPRTPLAEACLAAGMTAPLQQVEMMRGLSG
jgi:ribosomal protein S18 acetylase RimI-like enzyme